MKALLFLFLGITSIFCVAQDGSYDVSFGNNGNITYDITPFGENHEIRSFNQDNLGNTFVILESYDPIESDYLTRLMSFSSEGLLNENFGNNGIISLPNENSNYRNLITLPDNTFFIVTSENSVLTFKKYLNNGEYDFSFGNNGQLIPLINGETGSSYVLDEENNIYVIGYLLDAQNDSYHIYKYSLSGTIDTSFGNNGILSNTVNNALGLKAGGIQLNNNFLYVSTSFNENGNNVIKVSRLFLDGSLDVEYGTNGYIAIPEIVPYNYGGYNIFLDGSLLLSYSYIDNNTFQIFRKTIKFSSSGTMIQNFGNNGEIEGFAGGIMQQNNRVILNGTYLDWEGGLHPFYKRFRANGAIDTNFEFAGNYGEYWSFGLKMLKDGKLLLLGTDVWYNGPEFNLYIKRFNNNPLSIEENTLNRFNIFPNPSNGIFTIALPENVSSTNYTIYSSMGLLIKEGVIDATNKTLDLSLYSSGLYFLNLENQTFKLIKN